MKNVVLTEFDHSVLAATTVLLIASVLYKVPGMTRSVGKTKKNISNKEGKGNQEHFEDTENNISYQPM
ncbi:hypothetical protein POVCU1_054640 [Plasmodium ovale curtisi]|uniref:PIR Superfamily Protein n=1 Tax=Plasmodium ovale curtisi TaxID=864141 RepID=A0A1A8X3C1_PLAOA|nr:hypothetical protein POVCU1_054640 [Plasmodium ovale curtisi]